VSLRFRRTVKLLPGVRLNLGLHGAGVSIGPRGLHVGVNRRGRYASAGIPCSGLYAVHHFARPGEARPQVTSTANGFLAGVLIAVVVMLVLVVLANSH
jgi:hypothetical protein